MMCQFQRPIIYLLILCSLLLLYFSFIFFPFIASFFFHPLFSFHYLLPLLSFCFFLFLFFLISISFFAFLFTFLFYSLDFYFFSSLFYLFFFFCFIHFLVPGFKQKMWFKSNDSRQLMNQNWMYVMKQIYLVNELTDFLHISWSDIAIISHAIATVKQNTDNQAMCFLNAVWKSFKYLLPSKIMLY